MPVKPSKKRDGLRSFRTEGIGVVTNIHEAKVNLKRKIDEFRNFAHDKMRQFISLVIINSMDLTPIDTGNLVDSFDFYRKGNTYTVYNTAGYSGYVHVFHKSKAHFLLMGTEKALSQLGFEFDFGNLHYHIHEDTEADNETYTIGGV